MGDDSLEIPDTNANVEFFRNGEVLKVQPIETDRCLKRLAQDFCSSLVTSAIELDS